MKASRLIEELENLIEKAGDLDVFIHDEYSGPWSPANVRILPSYCAGL